MSRPPATSRDSSSARWHWPSARRTRPDGRTAAEPTTAAAATPLTVAGLETNARVDPIGIPGDAPSLSWHSTSTGRGAVQSAYQVRVAASEADLGGRTCGTAARSSPTSRSTSPTAAPTSTPGTRYAWQVRVWNGDDEASAWSEPASFETGLLTTGDWGSAEWVGAAPGAELNRWSDYTADIDFDIDNLAIGAFFRAADKANGYMWQISTADGTGVPKFRPHRRVGGGYALSATFPSPASPGAAAPGHAPPLDHGRGRTITTRLDGTQIDQRTDATFARATSASARTRTASATRRRHQGREGDGADSTVLLDTDFSAGNPFDGGTVTAQGLRVDQRRDVLWRSPDGNMPILRTGFDTTAGKTVASARVYATARGIYELTLNGQKVGDQHMAPGWTDYLDRFQHQTYDVTDLVRAGDNAFGAELGNGWWAGRIAHLGAGQYGNQTSLLARLKITYTDGTTQWVDTDDATWKAATGGYTQADLIDGETYDARLAKPGWGEAGFDDASWTAAVTRPAPAGASYPSRTSRCAPARSSRPSTGPSLHPAAGPSTSARTWSVSRG